MAETRKEREMNEKEEARCVVCEKKFVCTDECFEVHEGELCPECTAEMRREEEQEMEYQRLGLA